MANELIIVIHNARTRSEVMVSIGVEVSAFLSGLLR